MYDRRPMPSGQEGQGLVLELPDNYRWFCRCIVSPKYFGSNDQLLPSVIRSLFWILKEKFTKRRTIIQVEELLLYLPGMLKGLPIDIVPRFVKMVSDEARLMRDRIQQQFAIPAVEVAPGNAAQQDDMEADEVDRAAPVVPVQADGDAPAAAQPPGPLTEAQARRSLEPIRIAVLVCASTATYYPVCFSAETLATIIRNTFNLVAWGVPRGEIKYIVTNLSTQILRSVDTEHKSFLGEGKRRVDAVVRQHNGVPGGLGARHSFDNTTTNPTSNSTTAPDEPASNGVQKLDQLISIFDTWIPTTDWNFARETLTELRELFAVHLRRMKDPHWSSPFV
jgi:hypothetical protein